MNKPIKPKPMRKKPETPLPPQETATKTAWESPPWWHEEVENYQNLTNKEIKKILLEVDEEGYGVLENWGRENYLEKLSPDEFMAEIYVPSWYECGEISLAEITKNIPKDIVAKRPEDITIEMEKWYPDMIYGRVIYTEPNPDYEDETIAFKSCECKFATDLKKWKKDKADKNAANKKYREDMKKYKAWRENKIKALEDAGEL